MGKLSIDQKRQIVAAIEDAAKGLSSYTRVANKCDVAPATITHNMLKEVNWGSVKDGMWVKVAKALGVKFQSKWNVVETFNYSIVAQVLDLAQSEARWVPVSAMAGSGKTVSIDKYAAENENVYVLRCHEWSRRAFLLRLARTVGVNISETGYQSVETIGERVIEFFKQKAASSMPLLILDEAHDLRPSALRWLKVLYNSLKGELGVVIAGTESLKKQIKSGVKRHAQGYDELDSRFGRHYVNLLGATKEDVVKICEANGLTDSKKIESAWSELTPEQVPFQGKFTTVVKDLRRLESIIIRETKLNFF